MRFRVSHLLLLTAIVAFFATAFAIHSEFVASVVVFVSWMVYASLGWWAYAQPKSRFVICSALIFGVSYLLTGLYLADYLPPTLLLSESVLSKLLGEDDDGYRLITMEFAWSFVFALMGGALAAYWSRPYGGAEKEPKA